MKYLQLILWGLGSLFLAAEAGVVADEKLLSSDSDEGAIYQAKDDFKCPKLFGTFSDSKSCAHYYVCFGGIASRKKCSFNQHYDTIRRVCLPKLIAVCGKDNTKITSTPTVTTEATTKMDNYFNKCRWGFGTFPHPTDCSKYYKCVLYVPSLQTCPEKQLFDTGKSKCRPENEVDCGSRQRPGFVTTLIPTEPIVTEVPETSATEEEIIVSTTEAIISTEEVTDETTTEVSSTEEVTDETTTEVSSTEEVTTETITEVSSTTRVRPTGPPDHTCDEEDVDCIITETGDVQDWFICPRDIGSFTHPSSDRLFIFCMNWIPTVKKCGQDLVYSAEHRTCIEKKYFAKLLL